jgi:hypothetical protein
MRVGLTASGVAFMALLAGCNATGIVKPGTTTSGSPPEPTATRLDLEDDCPLTGESGRLEVAPFLVAALVPLAAEFAKEVATRGFKAYADYLSSRDELLDATTTYRNGGDLYVLSTSSEGQRRLDLGFGCIVLIRGTFGPFATGSDAGEWTKERLEDFELRRPPEFYAEIVLEPFNSAATERRLEPPIARFRLVGFDYRHSAASLQSESKSVGVSIKLTSPGDDQSLVF